MIGQSANGNFVRPAKRFPTKEPAQIEVYGRFGKIYCKMGNLSTGGAFFEIVSSNFMPRQGDLVRITIHLKQLNRIHSVDAEVIWCKGLGMGIMFLKKDTLFEKLSTRTSTGAQLKAILKSNEDSNSDSNSNTNTNTNTDTDTDTDTNSTTDTDSKK